MEAAQVIEKYPYLQKAYDKIQELSRDPANNVEYTERLISYFDEIGRLTEAERRMEEGFEKGAHDAKLEMAKKALARGLDPQTIVELTGLTEQEIKSLNT